MNAVYRSLSLNCIKTFSSLMVVVLCTTAYTQPKAGAPSFQVGEVIEYDISYNWGFVWITAGSVKFEVKQIPFKGRKMYFFESFGTSKTSYDWFFKVRDGFKAYVDTATLAPYWAERTSDEGGYMVYERYQFDYQAKKCYSYVKSSKTAERYDTLRLQMALNDLLTAIYYTRNLDFSKCALNEKIPIWALVFGKTYPLYIRYLGMETIADAKNVPYRCLKFSSKLVEGTIFRGGEDLYVWVTDDPNHLAIKIQAKILVGSIIATISNTSNLKYPLSGAPVKH